MSAWQQSNPTKRGTRAPKPIPPGKDIDLGFLDSIQTEELMRIEILMQDPPASKAKKQASMGPIVYGFKVAGAKRGALGTE
jgi:hypothetical protein